jgi:fructokinase
LAKATLDRHASRLARGLAHVINIFDPHVLVLGGGLSGLAHLYELLPERICRHLFAAHPRVTVRPPRWGDASGVRGAAWLWGLNRRAQ